MPVSKSPLASLTLWFNVLALIVLIADPFGFKDHVNAPELAEYASAIVTVINVVLRFVTKRPISLAKILPR